MSPPPVSPDDLPPRLTAPLQIEMAGCRWLVSDQSVIDSLRRSGELLASPDSLGTVVKRGPHRTTWRVDLAGQTCYLKHSHSRSWASWLRKSLNGSPATREFRRLAQLRAAGLPAPLPLAVAQPLRSSSSESWLLTAAASGAPLDELAPPERRPSGTELSRVQRNELSRALAGLLSDLHARGFWHRDLHAGNLLWQSTAAPAGNSRLTLVDVAAIEPLRTPISRARRWHNLAQLRHAFVLTASRSDQLRCASAYLADALQLTRQFTPALYHQALRDLAANCHSYSRQAWDKADRKWARGNRRVVILSTPTAAVRGVARLSKPLLELVAQNPANLPTDCEWREFPRARALWEMGHALLRRGIPACEPLILRETATGAGCVAFTKNGDRCEGITPVQPDIARLQRQLADHGFAFADGCTAEDVVDLRGTLAVSPTGLARVVRLRAATAPPRIAMPSRSCSRAA